MRKPKAGLIMVAKIVALRRGEAFLLSSAKGLPREFLETSRVWRGEGPKDKSVTRSKRKRALRTDPELL